MRFFLYNYYFLALTIAQVFCECGKAVVRVNSLIVDGFPAELGSFPWHVGVYYMNWTSGYLNHICGGSLISSDLVISAAHCFYDEDKRRIDDPLNYAVAAGKIQRSYYKLENAEQKSQVKSIHLPYGYNDLRGNLANDIAVVRLRRSFVETQFVGPVCIDWTRKYIGEHLRNGTIGKVTGWGLTAEGIPSKELQKIDLPYIDRDYCRRGAPEDFVPFVTNDKICAGYLNGSSVCNGDSGGGYCFQSDRRWYLRGVVSVNSFSGTGTCNDNYYSGFTNVGHYLAWIIDFFNDSEERDPTMDFFATGSCSLPEQPEGGRFEQHSCGKLSDHAAGSRVPIDSVLIYRCDEGYTLRGKDYSICEDKGWTPPPTCIKPCPALRLANGDILCKYNGEIVPCESAMAPGTRAILECRNYYEISPALKEITCLEGGVWTSPEFQCVPDVNIPVDTTDEDIGIEGRPNNVSPETTTAQPFEPFVTTATPPATLDECRLPYVPAQDPDSEKGWQFGIKKHSRLEFSSLQGRYMNDYDIQIDFKTLADQGLIFYSADLNEQALIAVYIKEGKVHYKFDCGSGPALLIGLTKVNDNQWHTVTFKRKDYGELLVDDESSVIGYSVGNTKLINVIPPFYVGGVLPGLSNNLFMSTGINSTFNGCLKNFMINGLSFGEPTEKVGVIPCSKRVEPGLFFYPGNGTNHYKDTDKHQFGGTINIQMDIKPRTTSGHLLSTHGKRDYLLLEMYNGTIRFLVKTQKGIIETSYKPPKPNSLCDGNWHSIRVVRQKNAVLLSVDHKTVQTGFGVRNTAGLVSRHPIYIGGHMGSEVPGSKNHQQYVGCIKNVHINEVPMTIDPMRAFGQVITSICPTI